METEPLPEATETSAKALISRAETLSERKRHLDAIRVYKRAIALLQDAAPSYLLADTWREMSMEYWYHKRGLTNLKAIARHAREMINAYEQGIRIWEKLPDQSILGGNLTNLSAMYYQLGQFDMALARAERGLSIEKTERIGRSEQDPESVHAWTHVIGAHTMLGQLNHAEAVLKDAIATFPNDNNALSYLYDLQAVIYDKRAEYLRKLSRELRPEEACHT
jgi:tetratricopeptide (TPR) repeat protein